MFKVSFKDNSKIVVKEGRKITVIIRGIMKLPPFFHDVLPKSIFEWVEHNKLVVGQEDIARSNMHLQVHAIARCADGDMFDPILGERIAEARTKIKLYKFLYTLILKLCDYYNTLLFGDGVVDSGTGDCLMKDLRKYEGLLIKEAHHLGELLKECENG